MAGTSPGSTSPLPTSPSPPSAPKTARPTPSVPRTASSRVRRRRSSGTSSTTSRVTRTSRLRWPRTRSRCGTTGAHRRPVNLGFSARTATCSSRCTPRRHIHLFQVVSIVLDLLSLARGRQNRRKWWFHHSNGLFSPCRWFRSRSFSRACPDTSLTAFSFFRMDMRRLQRC